MREFKWGPLICSLQGPLTARKIGCQSSLYAPVSYLSQHPLPPPPPSTPPKTTGLGLKRKLCQRRKTHENSLTLFLIKVLRYFPATIAHPAEHFDHRLNMELDLQSLFGLHVTWCAQLTQLTHWLRPRNPPPRLWAHVRGRYWSPKIDDISLWPSNFVDIFADGE